MLRRALPRRRRFMPGCASGREPGVAALGEQRGVDRRQPDLRAGAIAGEKRQLVGLLQRAGEVGAAQVVHAGAGLGRLLDPLDQHTGVDSAAVVALDCDAAGADGQCLLPLGDGAGTGELGVEGSGQGVERGLVDRAVAE